MNLISTTTNRFKSFKQTESISVCSADKPFGITQPFEPEMFLTNQKRLLYLSVPMHSQMVISNSLCFLFIKMHDNFDVWLWHLLYGNLSHGIAE